MKNTAVYLITTLMVSIFIFVSAYSQEDMEFVDNSVFENPQRESSVFRHDEHNEKAEIEECYECHHIYENGKRLDDETSEDQSCAECHDEKSNGNTPGLKKAFHTNCKGCHLEQKKGPIMCGECHIKG